MKNAIFWLGGAIMFLYKAVSFLFKYFIGGLASLAVFFGLEVPVLYVTYGAILSFSFGFDSRVEGVNQSLYFVGLWVAIIAAVVITIKHLFANDNSNTMKTRRMKYKRKRERPARRIERVKAEKPRIYRSKMQPQLIIHEYQDRYKIYDERGELLRIEYK